MKASLVVTLLVVLAACSSRAQPLEPTNGPSPVAAIDAGMDAKLAAGIAAGIEASETASDAENPPAADIDLNDYGRDPAYRQPVPTPPVPTADERAILDEIDRIARVFAKDLSRSATFAELGRPTSDPSADRVAVDPRSPHFAVMHVRMGQGYEEIEARLFEPIAVGILMTRFGTFDRYMTDDREDPQYASDPIDHGGAFTVTVEVHSFAGNQLAEDRVRVIYLLRDRRQR